MKKSFVRILSALAILAALALITLPALAEPREETVPVPDAAPEQAEACQSPEDPNREPYDADEGRAYSRVRLIVTAEPEAERAELETVFEKYGLETVYAYRSCSLYAVRLPAPANAKALDALIAALEAEPCVRAVERDHVNELHGEGECAEP